MDFTQAHEGWELDELVTVAVFLAFGLMVFALRRWQEALKAGRNLEKANGELAEALKEIQKLQGILPICSACHKIRNDQGYWERVEAYIETRSEARFSHSMCPDCLRDYYGDEAWFKKLGESDGRNRGAGHPDRGSRDEKTGTCPLGDDGSRSGSGP